MRRFTLVMLCGSLFLPGSTEAATIFESGTLGPTGVTFAELTSQAVPGTNVTEDVFVGVRFHLDQPVVTTQVGGHFVGSETGDFFGAIIALSNENDFPDTTDLSSADVLGHTLLAFPSPSAEVLGDLNLQLSPGWYALAFGSGLFGATANGGAVRNGIDIDDPAYISLGPNVGWRNLAGTSIPFDNHRFFIRGVIVPEPVSNTIAIFISILLPIITPRWNIR